MYKNQIQRDPNRQQQSAKTLAEETKFFACFEEIKPEDFAIC
jgi:hypothetical protein